MKKSIEPLYAMASQIWVQCKAHKTSVILLLSLSMTIIWLKDAISDNEEAISLFQQKKQEFDFTKKNLTLLQQSTKNNQSNILFAIFKRKKFDQDIHENMLQQTLQKLSKKMAVRLRKIRVTPDELWDKDLNVFIKQITFSAHAKNNVKFYQFVHMLQQILPGLVIFKDVTFQKNSHNAEHAYGQVTFLWARKKNSLY